MIINKTYGELKEEIKNIKRELSTYYLIEKELIKEGCKVKEVTQKIKQLENDLKTSEKMLNKLTDYGKIKVAYDGDYDRNITIIEFKKGTKKDFKKMWLKFNDLVYQKESYDIYLPYDCTGQIFTTYVEYKGSKVIITSLKDC